MYPGRCAAEYGDYPMTGTKSSSGTGSGTGSTPSDTTCTDESRDIKAIIFHDQISLEMVRKFKIATRVLQKCFTHDLIS